jgi:uncharacterized membrane protein YeiH
VFDPLGLDVSAAIKMLVLALDLVGTFVFALSGAFAAARHRLDFFGIMVVSFAAGHFGGITRDLLIGAIPPAAISDWRYLAASLVAGVLTFFCHSYTERLRIAVLVFDAAGLALFAVSGTQKALSFGLNPVMAALLGMVTGIGGGIMRDVLVNEVPTVLRSEIYAVAALAGAAVMVAGHLLLLPSAIVAVTGSILCFGIRMLAILRNWQLPAASPPTPTKANAKSHPSNAREDN